MVPFDVDGDLDDGDHGVMPVTKVIMPRLKDGDQRRKMILAITCTL